MKYIAKMADASDHLTDIRLPEAWLCIVETRCPEVFEEQVRLNFY